MFLNEGTMKENSSKTIANKNQKLNLKIRKRKKSSVKKKLKKRLFQGLRLK